eukprot:1389339-Rhodomonas_salina.2
MENALIWYELYGGSGFVRFISLCALTNQARGLRRLQPRRFAPHAMSVPDIAQHAGKEKKARKEGRKKEQ